MSDPIEQKAGKAFDEWSGEDSCYRKAVDWGPYLAGYRAAAMDMVGVVTFNEAYQRIARLEAERDEALEALRELLFEVKQPIGVWSREKRRKRIARAERVLSAKEGRGC